MSDSIDPTNLQFLVGLLTNEEPCLRGAGAFGLVLAGPEAKSAIAALREALGRENDTEVARMMVYALEDIGVEAAPALVVGLKHPAEEIREASEEALHQLAVLYREGGVEVPELSAAFAESPELRDLMLPLGEHLGLAPRTLDELAAVPDVEGDAFRRAAQKRELANALEAAKKTNKGPH